MTDVNVVLKRFDNPDELREFEKGKFELVTLGGMTIGTKHSDHVIAMRTQVGQNSG